MANIETLIPDIERLLVEGSQEVTDELYNDLGREIASIIKNRLESASKEREFTLRMSNIGSPCVRKLYLEKNADKEQKEELDASTLFKFLYGDIIESVSLFLAKASGHNVEGQQDTQSIAGIKGHRDAVIDGTLVDVKSASSFSFKKFKDGKLAEDDPFGYRVQLQSYLAAGQNDPIVTDKNRAAFFVIDKTLGHMCLDFHDKEDWNMEEAYEERKEVVHGNEIPDRAFDAVPDGKSGNEKLDTFCSYCGVKNACWPNLRTFLSSRGPLYLTKVKREPKMPEVVNGDVITPEDKIEKAEG